MIVTTEHTDDIYKVVVNGITVATTNAENELEPLYQYYRKKYEGLKDE